MTGSSVPGCSGGNGCIPAPAIEGITLNHAVGSWSWLRSNRVRSVMVDLLRRGAASVPGRRAGWLGHRER